MMRSSAAKAFDLDEEPAAVHDAYGRNPFGQGCLLARRLVERGVPFVEVTLSSVDGTNGLGWDTHAQNFDAVEKLSGVLDAGWSTLMTDLRARGLLDSTLIVWMGEFGRTPKINESAGRDHFPNAWSTVLAGGGIRGGQAIGNTGADGEQIKDRPVLVPDLLATVIKGLGIDPAKQNTVDNGRPIRLVDPKAKPDQGTSRMIGAAAFMVLALAAAPPQEPAPAAAESRCRAPPDLPGGEPADLRPPAGHVAGPAVRGVVDRLRPGAPRQPRPQRRRHAHDQGGRPGRSSPPSCGWRPARPRSPLWASWTSTRKTARSRSTSWPRPSARSWAPSGSRSGGRRSAAPTRSSINSTATRTAQLTRPELAAIAGSLRPLDLDDDEMISADELEPYNSPAFTALMEESSDRRARFTALPPVVELVAGESIASAGPALAQEI